MCGAIVEEHAVYGVYVVAPFSAKIAEDIVFDVDDSLIRLGQLGLKLWREDCIVAIASANVSIYDDRWLALFIGLDVSPGC